MKKIIKEFIGTILVKLQPEKVETLIKKGISFNVKNELSLSERFMRSALLKNAEKNQDFDMLADYHEFFWKETGRKYWIKENGTNNMIIFTSGGVLEYFTEQRLQEFFSYLNKLGTSIFIAIEPIGANIDFSKNPNSQPYGVERSFSHDYARLFKNAGFNLWHESKAPSKMHEDYFGVFGAINK